MKIETVLLSALSSHTAAVAVNNRLMGNMTGLHRFCCYCYCFVEHSHIDEILVAVRIVARTWVVEYSCIDILV